MPAAGDFTVTVGGSAVAVSAVAVDGAKVVLTLAEEAQSGDAVVLSYTPGAVPIADAAGNEAAALVGEAVDGGVDARAPAVSAAEVRGAVVTVVYDEPLDESSVPVGGGLRGDGGRRRGGGERGAGERRLGGAGAGRGGAGGPDGGAGVHAGDVADTRRGGGGCGGVRRRAVRWSTVRR